MIDREGINRRIAVIVVAGVSGSGKSTLGATIAAKLGWPYAEADEFHPAANIEKMSKGIPLTDADRAPWLAAIAGHIEGICKRGEHAVVSCSALKRAYRDQLVGARRETVPCVKIVLLDGDEATIGARLSHRAHHFMPASLLKSQFATLERPTPDEHVVVVPIAGSAEETVERTLAAL
jgi:gluconokinase